MILSLILTCILCVTPTTAKAAEEETPERVVRVGSFEDTFNYVNEKGARKGYGYELLETLSGYTGWKFEYVTCDWSNCFEKLINGEFDIMGDISYTEERAKQMLFSDEPMGEEKYYLYADLSDTDISAYNFQTLNGKKYYFNTGSGKMAVGWTTIDGNKYYFDKETGVMATGDVTIDGQKYHFNSNGILSNTTSPTGSRTIKNYLAGALQPVGQALYVWGGGWNDSTRKGTSQTMTDFYNSQSSSYDYNNYRDLSTANRAKGFDCSGFVGWSAYQVMQSKSGVGSGYTVVSGEIGSYYKSMGWGSILTQANLASDDWTVYPGDVGYDSGHTWIILGQCADKSAVIVHSTPNAGVQIAGTPTPSGGYSSQAIALAQKYMSRYPGYTKYDYHTSSGNYIRRGNYLRWNRSTLSDPDGYMNMTADQILADLFS